jgi:hypothetical protein
MIEITYTHIYKLTPTLGVTQKHAIHPPKINTPKSKEISFLIFLQKERGDIEKKVYAQKSIEKMCSNQRA